MDQSIKLSVVLLICNFGYDSSAVAISDLSLNHSNIGLCAAHTRHHERHNNMPKHLLTAISKVESGQYHRATKQFNAWPWTINVNGTGYRFATKTEAVHQVSQLMARGVKNIDIGCMQVNLRHHPKAFHDIEAAFDPHTNIEYGARYLTALKSDLGSWHKAVAYYHSTNVTRHVPYRNKVYDMWRQEHQRPPAALIRRNQHLPAVNKSPAKLYKRQSGINHNWRLVDARQQLKHYKTRARQILANNKLKCQSITSIKPLSSVH